MSKPKVFLVVLAVSSLTSMEKYLVPSEPVVEYIFLSLLLQRMPPVDFTCAGSLM